MKRKKNVSKEEIKNSLIQSIEYNEKALDYIENVLNRAKDTLAYNENDLEYKDIVATLEYIKFTLEYVGNQYNDSLKKVGVIRGINK